MTYPRLSKHWFIQVMGTVADWGQGPFCFLEIEKNYESALVPGVLVLRDTLTKSDKCVYYYF